MSAASRDQFMSYPAPRGGCHVLLGGDSVVGRGAHDGRLHVVIERVGGSLYRLRDDDTGQVRIASLARPGTCWTIGGTTYRID